MAYSMVTSGMRQRGTFPQSFADCAAILGKRRERKIANNTTLRPLYGRTGKVRAYAVRLHGTDVVTFFRNGTRRLDTGGWQTPTTRDRLRACGCDVWMASGVAALADSKRGSVAFLDGVRVLRDGTVRGDGGDVVEARKVRAAALRAGCTTRWPGRQGGKMAGGNAPEAQPCIRRKVTRRLSRLVRDRREQQRREMSEPFAGFRREGVDAGRNWSAGEQHDWAPLAFPDLDGFALELHADHWDGLVHRFSFGCHSATVDDWARNAYRIATFHVGDDAAHYAAFLRGVAEGVQLRNAETLKARAAAPAAPAGEAVPS